MLKEVKLQKGVTIEEVEESKETIYLKVPINENIAASVRWNKRNKLWVYNEYGCDDRQQFSKIEEFIEDYEDCSFLIIRNNKIIPLITKPQKFESKYLYFVVDKATDIAVDTINTHSLNNAVESGERFEGFKIMEQIKQSKPKKPVYPCPYCGDQLRVLLSDERMFKCSDSLCDECNSGFKQKINK